MAVPAGWVAYADRVPVPVVATEAPPANDNQRIVPDDLRIAPDEGCLASFICGVKNKVRWRQPAWTPDFCRTVSHAVLSAAREHDVEPSLLLAVMLNESDLSEKAFLVSERNGVVYAKDSGLMGIRCVVDDKGRCTNGSVRGMTWKELMDPVTNIHIGAHELAKWRTSGVVRATVRQRDAQGRLHLKDKFVTCQHKTHAYWAHYNHGPLYIDQGTARHYPHRIAVLYYAIAHALDVPAPELAQAERITIRDPGRRARTPDRPIEARYRKLADQIRSVGGTCSNVASLPAKSQVN